MTAQSQPQLWMEWWRWLKNMNKLVGRVVFAALLFGAWLMLLAVVALPIGNLVVSYWTPKVERMFAPAKVDFKKARP